jgi:hypothetical protein
MKTPRLLFYCVLLVSLLLGAGCNHRLPNVKADSVVSRTSTLGVVSTAKADGISVTDTYIVAATAEWTLSFPGFDHTTTATNYRQRREKEEKEKSEPTPAKP